MKIKIKVDLSGGIFFALSLLMIVLFLSSCSEKSAQDPLLLYCAAGIKPPIEKLARDYEEKYGVKIGNVQGHDNTRIRT